MASELKIHPLASIDSQILYRQFESLASETIFNGIVKAAKAIDIEAMDCELLDISTENDVFVRCGDLQVSVTQSVPFADDDYLQVALDSFSVENSVKALPAVADDITACLHISVQKQDTHAHVAKDMEESLTGFGSNAFADTKECLRAMKIAKRAAMDLAEQSDPAAVFWGPSTFFLDTDKFLRLASADNPLLLYLHCHVYSKDDPETGEMWTGAVASGAQWLIGSIVEVRPCPLPAEYLVERIFDFVGICLKNGTAVADGDTFGRDENESVQVVVHPSEDQEPARIELKVVHYPGLGIRRKDLSDNRAQSGSRFWLTDDESLEDEQEDLDPNDPVDAAILERLAEIKQEEQVSEDGATEQTDPLAGPEVPPPPPVEKSVIAAAETSAEELPATAADSERPGTPATLAERRPHSTRPSPRRMSMEELRDFVKEAQVAQPIRDPEPKKRGLIGKLFGRKSG